MFGQEIQRNSVVMPALAQNIAKRIVLDVTCGIDLHPHFFHAVEQTTCGDLVAIGQLPVTSPYLTDSPDHARDPLFLAEFIRQGIEVISRVLLDVPFQDHFILKSVHLTADRDVIDSFANKSFEVTVVLPADQVRRRHDGSAYAADGPFHCYFNEQLAAQYSGTVAFMKPTAYAALRGEASMPEYSLPEYRLPPGYAVPLTAQDAGKMRAANVFIGDVSAVENMWSARVLPQVRSPFFDRPLDHYPGMHMAEAARQIAVHAMRNMPGVTHSLVRICSIEMAFLSFVELDEPLVLHATAMKETCDSLRFKIVATQGGHVRTSFIIDTCFTGPQGAST
jgi:hypothetical protein